MNRSSAFPNLLVSVSTLQFRYAVTDRLLTEKKNAHHERVRHVKQEEARTEGVESTSQGMNGSVFISFPSYLHSTLVSNGVVFSFFSFFFILSFFC